MLAGARVAKFTVRTGLQSESNAVPAASATVGCLSFLHKIRFKYFGISHQFSYNATPSLRLRCRSCCMEECW